MSTPFDARQDLPIEKRLFLTQLLMRDAVVAGAAEAFQLLGPWRRDNLVGVGTTDTAMVVAEGDSVNAPTDFVALRNGVILAVGLRISIPLNNAGTPATVTNHVEVNPRIDGVDDGPALNVGVGTLTLVPPVIKPEIARVQQHVVRTHIPFTVGQRLGFHLRARAQTVPSNTTDATAWMFVKWATS